MGRPSTGRRSRPALVLVLGHLGGGLGAHGGGAGGALFLLRALAGGQGKDGGDGEEGGDGLHVVFVVVCFHTPRRARGAVLGAGLVLSAPFFMRRYVPNMPHPLRLLLPQHKFLGVRQAPGQIFQGIALVRRGTDHLCHPFTLRGRRGAPQGAPDELVHYLCRGH